MSGRNRIDEGINLDDGMRMIKRAVEQRADDGYIVDSLGWAYYRLGSMEEAVKQLERAIELKPEDPTINDHLGDAYWKVGRVLEARFQWSHPTTPATGSGGPPGKRNGQYRHGERTKAAIAEQRKFSALLKCSALA